MKRNSLSQAAKRTKSIDNNPAAKKAKIELRKNVLDFIGRDNANVFDAFAGSGEMFGAVWQDAKSCVGCDLKFYRDARLAFVSDNKRVLRAISLDNFNIFDFDAYGSPWEQCYIVAARKVLQKGEKIGFILTDGTSNHLKMGGIPVAVRMLAGIKKSVAGGSRSHDEITERCLAGLCKKMNADIKKMWRARGKSAARVVYIGFVLEGI